MSAPWRHATSGLAAATLVLATLNGCAASAAAFAPCPAEVSRVEIFNTYAHHTAADRHVIVGDEARTFCDTAFPYDQLPSRSFSATELEQRRITVMRFTGGDGSVRTLWAYGLAGYDTGMAIVLDDGTSYYLANRGLLGYYAASAIVIPRAEVPRR